MLCTNTFFIVNMPTVLVNMSTFLDNDLFLGQGGWDTPHSKHTENTPHNKHTGKTGLTPHSKQKRKAITPHVKRT